MDEQTEFTRFLEENMEDWINQTVIKEMKAFALAAALPDAFLAGITLTKIPNGYRITNTWSKDDKPLADYFEFGTRDHWIQPKNPDGVLAWGAPGSSGEHHGSAIYFQSGNKKGTSLFSKGHYVSGIARSDAMQRGYDIGMIQLKILISDETEKYKRRKGYD